MEAFCKKMVGASKMARSRKRLEDVSNMRSAKAGYEKDHRIMTTPLIIAIIFAVLFVSRVLRENPRRKG